MAVVPAVMAACFLARSLRGQVLAGIQAGYHCFLILTNVLTILTKMPSTARRNAPISLADPYK